MALTAKQQAFVEEYLKDLNATQAAVRAGYSAKTAMEQGYQLLQNTSVSEAITAAKATRSERTRIDADWVLQRLADEATADVNDIYSEDGRIKPVKDWPLVWRQGLVAGLEVETIGEGAGHVTKVKLSDRIKRIELIGKHVDVSAFEERVKHSGTMAIVVSPADAQA